MASEHVIVVGGGLAGLAAGCYARSSGFRTTIVEHHRALGGVCTAWSRAPYTIDGCIQWLTGGPFDQLYEELGILPEKDALADLVQRRLEEQLPELRGAVRLVDLATPLTFWAMARSWRGAYEGWIPSPSATFSHVRKRLPGLSGFYMAGQWVEPGGGVPLALMSGRHAVQLLCEDTGRAFKSS